jgi:hypothetical protein
MKTFFFVISIIYSISSSSLDYNQNFEGFKKFINDSCCTYKIMLERSLGCQCCTAVNIFFGTDKSKHIQRRKRELETFIRLFEDIKDPHESQKIDTLLIFLKQINKNSKKGGQLETFYKSCSFAIDEYLRLFSHSPLNI